VSTIDQTTSTMTAEQTSREISRVVSAALNAAGITQRAAANAAGMSLNTLNRRLTGKSAFLVTELPPLASLLGVPVSDLVAAAAQGDTS
jgi:transcriptional regulator with XRE-family HTH domain